ncbi:hypothetical protein IT411_01250 [Candidatus Peregrinibacteria bacterium]|nr:hypothetical protein [Candidatus Peregrinibacteria bacterium]
MNLKVTASVLSLVSVLALAGCQPQQSASTNTSSSTSSTSSESSSTSEGGKIATPGDAKNLNNVSAAGNDVTTYSAASAVDVACGAQAKMVTDAGWKASSSTPSPIQAGGAWTQTFESGKEMVVLACTADPMNAGSTMVTMTKTANVMMQ